MHEIRRGRSVSLQRLLSARHRSPPERAVRPSAAKRTVCGFPWSAAGKSEVFNNRSPRLWRLLRTRQPSPPERAVRPAAAKRTARSLRLNASLQGFRAPAAAVARHRLQGQRWLPAKLGAASGVRYPSARKPNPSFERTFNGEASLRAWPAPSAPLNAAQLKR